MSHIDDVARAWRQLLCDETPTFFQGSHAPRKRQQVYRDLVRRNLASAIGRACPHARRLAGEATFDGLITRFLAESPPTTRRMREVPWQFSTWLASLPAGNLPHPCFVELVHFETLEIDVTLSPTARDRASAPDVIPDVDEAAVVVVDPSTRLCACLYPVHRVTSSSTSWPLAAPAPLFLCCFQRADAFVVDVVSPAVARVLVGSTENQALGTSLDALAEEAAATGVLFERGRVRADLVDLQRRGALVGFRRL
jgi:hypothetical protein